MSAFEGMEDLLQDFLTEAGDLLSDVDNKLVELEKTPSDKNLLNTIFRGFHTVKGGAGFLNATPLVELCHRTENLFDKLRNDQLVLTPEIMDVIMAATGVVRDMFGALAQARMPDPAEESILLALDAVLAGETPSAPAAKAATPAAPPTVINSAGSPDWRVLYHALVGAKPEESPPIVASLTTPHHVPKIVPKVADKPRAPSATTATPSAKENTIRIDTTRLDQVLNLSGEIGLTKNRLTCLRTDIIAGKSNATTLQALDEAVSQLDLLVSVGVIT